MLLLLRSPSLSVQLATRLCQYLRPKIHPLLLDGTINSPLTVRLNLYQVCLNHLVPCAAHSLESIQQISITD